MTNLESKAAQPHTHKKTNLDWQARASLRKRIDDPDWDWEKAERYERHAINAILDMEEIEAVNRELLEALEKIRIGARSMCLYLNLSHKDFSSKDRNIEAADSIENKHGRSMADWYFELAECIRVAEAAIAKARGVR